MTESDELFVGVDVGTTNVKAFVVRPTGEIVARAAVTVPIQAVPDGGAEQDIEEIWQATREVITRAVASCEAGPRVRALGVSSQGGALQVLSARNKPQGRVISWLDGRGQSDDRALTAAWGGPWWAEHVGHGMSGLAVGQLQRLRREGRLPVSGFRIGFVGDQMVARLCGHAAHDATSLSLALLYNPWKRCADPELLQRLQLTESQLPDLKPAGQAAGGLRPEVAKDMGLTAGLPVSVAIHDQYAAALGCGAVHAGDVMFGAGTAWVLLAVTDKLVPPVIEAAFVCAHPVAELSGQLLSLHNGGSSLAWAVETLGLDGGDLDALLQSAPVGSDGLVFWPLLAGGGGAGLPAGAGGRLDGLRLTHRREHILRAVLEGLACELARHLRWLTAAGIEVRSLSMCGGAASSRVTPQIVADITGVPVRRVTEPDASVLGAAIVARGLTKPQERLAQIAEQMKPSARTLQPGPERKAHVELLERYLQSLPQVTK